MTEEPVKPSLFGAGSLEDQKRNKKTFWRVLLLTPLFMIMPMTAVTEIQKIFDRAGQKKPDGKAQK